MASKKAPNIDFAPAWLKIPDQDSLPSGPKSDHNGENKHGRPGRRDDYYNGYNRYNGPDYGYQPLQRQRSFDNYYDDRRYSPQKFRHHSMDDDYYSAAYGAYPYYNGYNYDKYGNHYRSQPTLFRDGKYQHPNARYGHQMNGAYPPYYEPYYDYYHGDPYYSSSYMGRPSPSAPPGPGLNPGPGKRYPGERERHHSRGEKDKDGKSGDMGAPKRKSSIEEEFPSLNGDIEGNEIENKTGKASGAWEKPPPHVAASESINGSREDSPLHENSPVRELRTTDGMSPTNPNLYKALVPNKSILTRKPNRDKSVVKDINSNSPVKQPNGSGSPLPRTGGKEKLPPKSSPVSMQVKEGNLRSPPVEILNTRLVTQPKNLSNKRGEFLRTLKENSSKGDSTMEERQLKNKTKSNDTLVNGMNELTITPPDNILSSSLEAEQRLLREMGWNEADEEEYVITEADMKEFQNLSQQHAQIKEKKNGLNRPLTKPWSPQHLPVYQPPANDVGDSLSSTSEDSDLDS